jgi:hypothetical protein
VVEPVVAVMRRSFVAFVAALAALGVVAGSSTAGPHHGKTTHKPPYKAGPSGGDEFNYVEADPETGEVTVLRIFPGIPPVVGCEPEPSAGWAMLRVPHQAHGRIKKVTVNFEGELDPYAWVTAGVRDASGEWLGVRKLQGPHTGEGDLVLRLNEQPKPHSTATVEFGIQLGDACPQVGGASVSFLSIVVE